MIHYLDYTAPLPEENLALDEYLLYQCNDEDGPEVLRFWEPTQYFVVLGRAKKIDDDLFLEHCSTDTIPIFRRVSGGGTVLQGPGCVNFSLILRTSRSQLQSIQGSNQWIMDMQTNGLKALFPQIKINGITDLVLNDIKCSGNAQRRLKHALLFHGAFLLNFNLSKIEKYLTIPKQQPQYRNQRSHLNFLCNMDISPQQLKHHIRTTWQANPNNNVQFSQATLSSWARKYPNLLPNTVT